MGDVVRLVVGMPSIRESTSPPTVSGTPAAGSVLTCVAGTWAGNPAFTFQWLYDGAATGGARGSSCSSCATTARSPTAACSAGAGARS